MITENIEAQALHAWFAAVSSRTSTRINWSRRTVGSALCYLSASEPSILVNRVLNLQADTTLEQLAEIRRLYRATGVARFFLHVIPEVMGPGREQLLAEAGYTRYRGWMKFQRGSGKIASATTTELSVRRIGAKHATRFAAIVGDAFDFRPAFQGAIAAVFSDPNWHMYMSFADDTPAGTGALYMRDGVGYLDFGATHPDFRRLGGQTAVLNTRVRDALEAGCTSIVTMTGEATPGDEQHSYRNILKAGFEEAYLRENWIPAEH